MLYVKPDDPLAGRVVSLWKCTEAGDKVSRVAGYAPIENELSILIWSLQPVRGFAVFLEDPLQLYCLCCSQ